MFIPVLMHGVIGMAAPWIIPATFGGGVISHCIRRKARDSRIGSPPPIHRNKVYHTSCSREYWNNNRTFEVR